MKVNELIWWSAFDVFCPKKGPGESTTLCAASPLWCLQRERERAALWQWTGAARGAACVTDATRLPGATQAPHIKEVVKTKGNLPTFRTHWVMVTWKKTWKDRQKQNTILAIWGLQLASMTRRCWDVTSFFFFPFVGQFHWDLNAPLPVLWLL